MGSTTNIIGALLLLGCPAISQAKTVPNAEQRRIFESQEVIKDAKGDEANNVYLTLEPGHMRFRLDGQTAKQKAKLQTRIDDAYRHGRTITVRYDAAGGRYVVADDVIDYPACAVLFGQQVFEPATPCQTTPLTSAPSGEQALALSFAHLMVSNNIVARAFAERSMAGPTPAPSKLALYARGMAAKALAAEEEPWSPAADRHLIAALADFRSLGAIDPESAYHQSQIGGLLHSLGAYDEARAHYDEMLERFPHKELDIRVGLSALHRQQGNYADALGELDEFVAKRGWHRDMKFQYYRGWTLLLLGRFEEAVAAFDYGLDDQADYSPALLKRACANAGLGNLKQALRDLNEAMRLAAAFPGAATSKFYRRYQREGEKAEAIVKRGMEEAPPKPIHDLCRGFEPYKEKPRTRSQLLRAS